jgi:hypothetical protein
MKDHFPHDPRIEAKALVIGTAVLYAAAAVNGAEKPPEVTDEQAKQAAVALLTMIAQADLIVTENPGAASLLRGVMSAIQGAFEAGEKKAQPANAD